MALSPLHATHGAVTGTTASHHSGTAQPPQPGIHLRVLYAWAPTSTNGHMHLSMGLGEADSEERALVW